MNDQKLNMSKKLLLIDNDSNNCLLVKISLKKFSDWQVTASSSEQALKLVQESNWDAILLEIGLQNGGGLRLFEQIQNDVQTRTIPVIFLTSRVMPDEMNYYAQLRIAGVIAKPFLVLELKDEISKKLNWNNS